MELEEKLRKEIEGELKEEQIRERQLYKSKVKAKFAEMEKQSIEREKEYQVTPMNVTDIPI